MSAHDDRVGEDNQAIGWLITALEREHPGFLAEQAAKAEGTGSHAGLARWAEYVTPEAQAQREAEWAAWRAEREAAEVAS